MNEQIHFKKILALVPEDLYNELAEKKMFNSDWDFFVAQAIKEKLKHEEEKLG